MSIQQLRKRVEALEKAHPVHSKEDEMQELRRRADEASLLPGIKGFGSHW